MVTSADIQRATTQASPAFIRNTLLQLKQNRFVDSRWLGKRNRYRLDTLRRIREDTSVSSGGSVRARHLAEYVAVSAILHCFDGWTFLSRAIGSVLAGDANTAVHLAYYAELRAAISFLASEGIAIFDRKHFWFDGSGYCHTLGNASTHSMVRRTIQGWAANHSKNLRLLELLQVEGRNFTEWLTAASGVGSGTMTVLAKEWLHTWSLDLAVLGEDHIARNEVSYRPQGISSLVTEVNLSDTLREILEYWLACEPSASGDFGLLDRHLLYRALRKVFHASTGSYAGTAQYEKFIDLTLRNLGIVRKTPLKGFLLSRRAMADHPLLSAARLKARPARGSIRPMSVIARAVLLLRIASAATNDLLVDASVASSEIRFWSSELSQRAGLWETGFEPEQSTDLWEDVQVAIDEIEDWLDSRPCAISKVELRQDLGFHLWRLEQFERAGLWAVGL